MNVIQLKIKLASVTLERTADDHVSATGTCQFQFSDRGSLQGRSGTATRQGKSPALT
jgi:hypothetical protein